MRNLMSFVATVKWAKKIHVVEAVALVAAMVYIVSQLVVTIEKQNVKTVISEKLQQMMLIKLKTLMIWQFIWQFVFQSLAYLGMYNGQSMNNMLNVDCFKLSQLIFYWKFWFDDDKKKKWRYIFIKWYTFQLKENWILTIS